MPLTPGRTKAIVKKNFEEFGQGPTYQHTAAKFGKDRANKQRIAVVLKESGQSKNPLKNPKRLR